METEILTPFLNRAGEFDPTDWFQLVPKGQFPIARKEGDKVRTYVQVVDDRAVEKIVGAFINRRASNPAFRILIDFEHFSHDPEKSSAAACWVTDMQARADGVWAKGEWSDEGAAAIKNRRYRYLSPVWFPRQIERIDSTRVRPIEVNDAGLTNKPNLGAALQPFWNREDFHGREAITENSNQGNPMKDRLILLCGLAATATDDQIVAAVEAFKNRASTTDTLQSQFTSLDAEHKALKNRHDTLLTTSVERVLEENKDLIPEGQKDAWKNRLTADFEGTSTLLKGLKRPAVTKTKPVHDGKKGAAAAASRETEEEDGTEPFMNRVSAVMTERKLDKADAIAAVATEEPELYAGYRESITSGAE